MRGMGVGVVVTALLCSIAFSKGEPAMTDEEVIARAIELGYTKGSGVTAEDISKIKENTTPKPETTPEATPEATPEPTPDITLKPTPEQPKQPTPVTENGKPTPEPTATPEPTKAPTVTPEPTKAPTATPKPTKAPTATPEPTKAPTATLEPTKALTATPEPTKVLTVTPAPSVYTLRVERGMTATQVASALASTGAIANAEDFVAYLRREQLTDYINIGTFTIPRGAGYAEIAAILTR